MCVYIDFQKSQKDIFNMIEEKNLTGKKPGISNCLITRHLFKVCRSERLDEELAIQLLYCQA